MATELHDTLKFLTNKPEIAFQYQDDASTPWASVAGAHNGVPEAYRAPGKIRFIDQGDGKGVIEYWYKGGIAIENLVPRYENLESAVAYVEILEGLKADVIESELNVRASEINAQNLVAQAGMGTPRGSFSNLTELISSNPDHQYIYLTTNNGHWNYWNGSAFISGGLYQSALGVVQSVGASESNVMSQKATSDQLNALKFGNVYLSGENKNVSAFLSTTFFKWDSSGTGAQTANITATKVSTNNVSSMQIVTNSSFTNSAPRTDFSATNRIFAFTNTDELKLSVISTIAGSCLMSFDLLNAAQSVVSSAEYIQLTNGNSSIYTTANASVKFIRLNYFGVSWARVGGSDTPTNFSGVSDTTFTFGIYDKGSSDLKTLKEKFSSLLATATQNSTDIALIKPELTQDTIDIVSIKWGGLNISGLNKNVSAFLLTTFFKWDSKSGAQSANITAVKTSANNICSMQITTSLSFTDAAPRTDFSAANRIFAFTNTDELKLSLISTIAGNCLINFDLLNAAQSVVASAEYVQLTNGNSSIYTTANASVKFIRFNYFGVGWARVSGSDVPTNFSGVSDTTFTFGIYDKGYSDLKTLKAKLTDLAGAINQNVADISLIKPELTQNTADIGLLKWGGLNISGLNKNVSAFLLTTFFKWDSKSGAQSANITAVKTSANNICSMQITTNSSFTDAAPRTDFSAANRIFAFTNTDELKLSLISTIAGSCLINFDLLNAAQSVVSSAEYIQLTNGNSSIYTTANASVKFIRFNYFGVSWARVSGSDVPTNFSGISDTTFSFGIYDKGYSDLKTLKAKLSELATSVVTNTSDVALLKNKNGDTCRLQLGKGSYTFINSVVLTVNNGLKVALDGNNCRFGKKAARLSVLDTSAIDQDGFTSRGLVTMTTADFYVSKSLSFWIKVPSCYLFTNPRAGATQKLSFGQMILRYYNGNTLLTTKTIFPEYSLNAGWNLYKHLSDDFIGLTINKITVEVFTYDRRPELIFWIDSFVADQIAQPVLTFSMDNDMDDRTVLSGWADYVKNNNIPMSLRVRLDANGSSIQGWQISKKLYETGLFDIGNYSSTARTMTNFAAAVEFLKNDATYGRLTILNKGLPVRDLIESHNATNYLDDILATEELEAGYKILRCSSGYSRSNYIDKKSFAIQCTAFGVFSTLGQITDSYIADQIQLGKDYIDGLIKYGSFGSLMSHQIVTRVQANSGDLGLASLYEVYVGIFDYALTKVVSGDLKIMTLSNLYLNSEL